MENTPTQHTERAPRESIKRATLGVFALTSIASLTFSPEGHAGAPESRELCADTIAPIGTYAYEELLSDLALPTQNYEAELAQYIEEIENTYDIPFSVDLPPSDHTPEEIAAAVNGAVDALEIAGAQLTTELALTEFDIVPHIGDGGRDSPAGLYTYPENKIVVAQASRATVQEVTLHELLGHAVDYQLLCPPGDLSVDTAFAQQGERDETRYLTNDNRLHARPYGATTTGEDRATTIENIFMKRGVIQPGDPDYGSAFQLKQVEMLRRLDMLQPGMAEFALQSTPAIRMESNELIEAIENPYKPGEQSSALAILAHAYLEDRTVEQLRGTTATIMRPEQGTYLYVQNPVVIRDRDNAIKALAWTLDDESSLRVTAALYEPNLITFQEAKDAYGYIGYIDATNDSSRGFLMGGLQIDGVPATEYTNPLLR